MPPLPLLSVCVPTYNRALLLTQSLRAILSQIGPAEAALVEVVVLDNASPDDTPDVVGQARRDFPDAPLRYIRRPKNIGCDANFCDAPNQARGEFVYLLSDDDILLPGAIGKLLQLIQEHSELDAFALNVRQFRDDPGEEGPQPFTLERDTVFPGRDEALLLLKTHIVFISSIAFRREAVQGRDYTAHYATNLAQSYMFLDALAPGRGLYATSRAYLAQRADRAEGYNFFRVFVTNFHALMQHARRIGYSSQAIQQVLAGNLGFIYHFVLIFKSRGSYDQLRPNFPDALIRLLRAYRWNRFVCMRIIPRILVPRAVFVPVQRLYTGLKARLTGRPAPVASKWPTGKA